VQERCSARAHLHAMHAVLLMTFTDFGSHERCSPTCDANTLSGEMPAVIARTKVTRHAALVLEMPMQAVVTA
jgi:hypothetical protein